MTGALLRTEDGTLAVGAGLVVGADGRRSKVARAVGAEVTLAGRHAGATVYGYVAGLADRGYRWHYGIGATAGAIPTNDGLHVVFAGIPPARFRAMARSDRTAMLGGVLARGASGARGGGRGRDASSRRRSASSASRASCAGPPGRAGRWSATPATSRTRSPRTGSPTRCATPSLLAAAALAGTDAALGGYEQTRDALSRPLFEVTEALASLDWSLDEAKRLHHDLSRAMRAEQDWIAVAPPLSRAA